MIRATAPGSRTGAQPTAAILAPEAFCEKIPRSTCHPRTAGGLGASPRVSPAPRSVAQPAGHRSAPGRGAFPLPALAPSEALPGRPAENPAPLAGILDNPGAHVLYGRVLLAIKALGP
jgi:hypothetical protein